MTVSTRYSRTSWFFKFCECLLAAIAILNILMMPLELLPQSFWQNYGQYFEYSLPGTFIVALAVSIIYSIFWQRRERVGTDQNDTHPAAGRRLPFLRFISRPVNSDRRHAWLQAIIRYWLALSISTYGFAKILKTQFQSPSYRLDIPLGEVNGFGLTWYYFGYSYTLAVILGLIQIGGSVLLLYRRTTLLGVMILLPVLVNIILINVFYSIAAGAFFNSVVFTLGLLFFLFVDWEKLKATFWDLVEHLPPITLGRSWIKHAIRVLPIALAFTFIKWIVASHPDEAVLKGTWKVETMVRNGQVLSGDAWLKDTTAWNRVYFAGWQGCAFSPNPYRYKPAESLRGAYEFDSLKNSLQVVVQSNQKDPKSVDTLRATISNRTAKTMRLYGVYRKDTVDMQLARLR